MVFPLASVYVQWTVYVPGSSYVRGSSVVAPIVPPQLSVAVGGFVSVTAQALVIVGRGSWLGTGAVASFTVTVNDVLAPSGLLVQVTSVSPTGKNEPDARSQVTVPQLPLAVLGVSNVTFAPHELAELLTTIGAWVVKVQSPVTA